VPTLFASLHRPYFLLHRIDRSDPVFAFGRALLAALVVLLPTVLTGGTFPVLVRFFVRSRRDVGLGTATLNAVDTLGAIAGCLLAGFVLIERFGFVGTTRLAAAANLAAVMTAAVAGGMLRGEAALASPDGGAEADELAGASAAIRRIALACIGLSGFAALELLAGLGSVASGVAFDELGRLSHGEVAHVAIRSLAGGRLAAPVIA
jgi:hypothetical protein